eukprot:jgi/Mesvir1/19255/Mv10337-RA.1
MGQVDIPEDDGLATDEVYPPPSGEWVKTKKGKRVWVPYAPPAPLMTEQQWLAEIKRREQEKKRLEHERHKELALKRDFDTRKRWYYELPIFRKHSVLPQCFDAKRRPNDYYESLQGVWVEHHLPLPPFLDHEDCYLIPMGKGKKKLMTHNCEDPEKRAVMERLQYHPKGCWLQPFKDETFMHLFANRTLWFVGDYISRQHFASLSCLLHRFQVQQLRIVPGSVTGLSGVSVQLQHNIVLNYLDAGVRLAAPRAEKHRVEGLGGDLLRRFDVHQAVTEHHEKEYLRQQDTYDDWGVAAVIQERMSEFHSSDVMIVNLGHDYKDFTTYQRRVMEFVRLHDENTDLLPILLWRETTAQHHDGYEGGDITNPLPVMEPVERDFLLGHARPPLHCVPFDVAQLHSSNWRNRMANKLLEQAGIPILRVFDASVQRHDWHSEKCLGGQCDRWGPCQHYCLPGAPFHWTEILFNMAMAEPIQHAFAERPPPSLPQV